MAIRLYYRMGLVRNIRGAIYQLRLFYRMLVRVIL